MVWIWDTNWCVWSPKDLHSIAVMLLRWLEGESPWAQSSCTSPATPQTGSYKCIAAHQNMLTCKYILIMIIVSKTPFKHQSFNITLNYLNIWKYPSWMTSEVDSPCAGCRVQPNPVVLLCPSVPHHDMWAACESWAEPGQGNIMPCFTLHAYTLWC